MSDRIIYHKVINGRDIFRDLPDKIVVDGMAIYNPSQEQVDNATIEQINAGGWYIFTPPTPPEPEPYIPTPQDEPDTYNIMQAVKTMLQEDVNDLSDEDALAVASLFPTWHSLIGQQVTTGERIWDDGKLWKVLQPHTVSQEWRPAEAVSLYVEVSIAEWPEYRQPTGAHDAYNTGDKVTFEGRHYICKMDSTTFSPAEYPAAWELVE